jgi:hypothetical protein
MNATVSPTSRSYRNIALWFGPIESRGFRTTHDAAIRRSPSYPFLIVYPRITTPSEVVAWIVANKVVASDAA